MRGGDATGGGAVFWVGWSIYNRVLRKKLIGLICGGLLGICFWREGLEGAFGGGRKGVDFV